MQGLQNTFKRVAAAVMFFTRLPLWRVVKVESRYFERVVPLWPLAGWLTGGVSALTCWAGLRVGLTASVATLLAILARTLLTGALHEDGLADFCDGMGGGTDRDSTLRIMKDSHIGTYGVLGLVFYELLLWQTLSALVGRGMSPLMLLAGDALAKWFASTMLYFLPYARNAAEAKNRLVYVRTPWSERLMSLLLGVAPMALVWREASVVGVVMAAAALWLLVTWMRRRLAGYTGDCCGATFLLVELVFFVTLLTERCMR